MIYKDVNLNNPTEEPWVTDVEVIYQSLDLLFSYSRNSKVFRPKFSLDLEDELFELIDEDSAELIFSKITDSISNNLPLVTLLLDKCRVEADSDNNRYEIDIYFEVDGFAEKVFKKSYKLDGKNE